MRLVRSTRTGQGTGRFRRPGVSLAASVSMVVAGLGSAALALAVPAAAAPVGQGFTVTPADLAFILKQIKIAEAHVRNTTDATGPCGALVGKGADQIPDPLTAYGLRTVDGSCNNLIAGREKYGKVDQPFPRWTTATFAGADPLPFAMGPGLPAGTPTSYQNPTGPVADAEPRVVSNLIVDQTSSNPAAVAAALHPVRSQLKGPTAVPCTTDPVAADASTNTPAQPGVPAGCTPSHQTLFIPNITTDVGLSPPFNGLFTLFGQFFDHGLDFTSKTGDPVFIPLKDDDPLVAGKDHALGTADDLPASMRFMVLSRTKVDANRDGVNRDTPWIDQSQTYTSHSSHQVFLREYSDNADGRPVATGHLLGGAGGMMPTWAQVKVQAANELGLRISDSDVGNIPMIAADAYGNFLPGPAHGLPMYVTATGMVEGDRANPVAPPADVKRIDTAFLDDIAHNAAPGAGLLPDDDTDVNSQAAPRPRGTYDDELLAAHFVAGDGRLNENIGLTAVHQIFHFEHDRLVEDVKRIVREDASGTTHLADWQLAAGTGAGAESWNGTRLWQAARYINEMEYQHLVFEEFARKVQPAIAPFHVYHSDIDPSIKAEFAHAVYRFGHSMLTDTIDRINEDGTHNDIPLLDGFLNPPSYADGGSAGHLDPAQATGAILMGMSDQTGNEIDEFVTETLRNNLLGLPLDLATLNITRARDAGVPSLNETRRQLFAVAGDPQVQPYTSWTDFGSSLKHPESLVNFVAAYGRHPSIVGVDGKVAGADGTFGTGDDEPVTLASRRAAATLIVDPPVGATPPADAVDFLEGTGSWSGKETGLNLVDLWVGGLAERTNLNGGMLGSTFNFVFENQLTDLQNGDRLYYLARTPGLNLRVQLEGNSFAEMIMRNTTAHSLKADAFGTADCKFELAHLDGTAAGYAAQGAAVADDPASACNETKLLIRSPDGTIRYRTTNSVDPSGVNAQSVYNGTAGTDRVRGGSDNDTLLGNGGRDLLEGFDGDDTVIGGDGNDRITDSNGADVLKGGPGNDSVQAGPGLDLVFAGDGADFTDGGPNDNETFGGPGNDFIHAGEGADTVFGDSGDDWIEGGSGQDLLQGDHGAPFFDDPGQTKPGNDVFVGQVGENDYDAEGGDDLMASFPAIERNAGAGGFDWAFHQYDTVGADDDMNLVFLGLPIGTVTNRDRWQETEADSGGPLNDRIVGDSVVPATIGGGGFSGCDVLDQAGIDRIPGLASLVKPSMLTVPAATVAAQSAMGQCPLSGLTWGAGNILVGGGGSDVLEGRGGNDIIDGAKYLHVRISVRDHADNTVEVGSATAMDGTFQQGNPKTLAQAVSDGDVDPGDLVIVRELLDSAPGSDNVDTAVFRGPLSNYTFDVNASVDANGDPQQFTVTDRTNLDGVDTLSNIEYLQFADARVPVTPLIRRINHAPTGAPTITPSAPIEGGPLTATPTFADSDGIAGPITFAWQAETAPDNWVTVGATETFTPGNPVVGMRLRVVASFVDGLGLNQSVTSAATSPVTNVNDPATGSPSISSVAPTEGDAVFAGLGTVADPDGLADATFAYRWQASTDGVSFTDVAGGTGATLVVGHALVGSRLRVTVSFTDDHGTAEQRTSSTVTAPVAPALTVPGAPVIGIPVAGDASATARWSAPATDGGSPVTSYTVTVLDANGIQHGPQLTADGAATSMLVTGLTNGSSYRFRVLASNLLGDGPDSALSDPVVPVAAATAPGAPAIGTTTRASGSLTPHWSAPAANGGSAVTGYQVKVLKAGVQVGALRPAAAGATALTVTGLTVGSAYTFQVQAVNAVGAGSWSAGSAAVVFATVPGAPVNGAPTQGAAGGALTATAAWTPPASTGGSAITGYKVYAQKMSSSSSTATPVGSPVASPKLAATARSYTFTLAAGNYRFQVEAINALGTGPRSPRSANVVPR